MTDEDPRRPVSSQGDLDVGLCERAVQLFDIPGVGCPSDLVKSGDSSSVQDARDQYARFAPSASRTAAGRRSKRRPQA
jgi:hypothetical protein